MNIHSSLFSPVTDEQIRSIIQTMLGTNIEDYKLLSGGLFNTTYFVRTKDRGDVILRIGPINRHLLLHFEGDMMAAEAIVYRILGERGIPSSELLAIDTSKALIDRDLMIVRYLPSVTYQLNRADYTYPPEDVSRLYRELGENIAKLHAVRGEAFGHVYDVADGRGYARWSEFLKAELDQVLAVCAPYDIFREQETKAMHEILEKYASVLDEITEPRLIHADLGPNNLLIHADRLEFAAFIDTDRAMWGDPDFDFAYMEWMYCDELWQGYGRPLAADEASGRRRLIYRMIRFACNAYVWEVEYNRHDLMLATREEIGRLMERL